jgi:hypothetical protein
MVKLTGNPENLKNTIPSVLMILKALEDVNVGTIVAERAIEAVRYKNTSELMVTIFWSASPVPPHWKPLANYNNKVLRPYLTLTGVDRHKLKDWELVKNICGSNSTGVLNYGMHRAIAQLDNGSKLVLHRGSVESAKKSLNAIIDGLLTGVQILTFTAGTESDDIGVKKVGTNLYKPRQAIYPQSIAIVNKQKMINSERLANTGRQLIDGKFAYQLSPKMPLWWKTKPMGWDAWVDEYTRRDYK